MTVDRILLDIEDLYPSLTSQVFFLFIRPKHFNSFDSFVKSKNTRTDGTFWQSVTVGNFTIKWSSITIISQRILVKEIHASRQKPRPLGDWYPTWLNTLFWVTDGEPLFFWEGGLSPATVHSVLVILQLHDFPRVVVVIWLAEQVHQKGLWDGDWWW